MAAVLALGVTGVAQGSGRMAFEQAAKPFAGHRYDKSGYVLTSGQVTKGALGCSGYAAAVLYRIRNGEAWQKIYQTDVKSGKWPHQWHGDKMAAHFQLGTPVHATAAEIADPAEVRRLFKAGALYFFNVRNGKEGHVGFVRADANGNLEQWHYSGLKGYNGLASGDFREWKSASQYRRQPADFYPVSE